MVIEYWHWLALGLVLCGLEIITSGFVLLWFGVAAIGLSIAVAVYPDISAEYQIFLWAIGSLSSIAFWHFVVRPKIKKNVKSASRIADVIGTKGTVIKGPARIGEIKGRVRFTVPVLGENEWSFRSEDDFAEGDVVVIKSVVNDVLVVFKN